MSPKLITSGDLLSLGYTYIHKRCPCNGAVREVSP